MAFYTIVKTIETSTYGKGLDRIVINEDWAELRRLASMDEAIDYVKAYMINDLHEYRIDDEHYGFEIMDKDDQKWMTTGRHKFVDGFKFQRHDRSYDCGFTVTRITYYVDVLRK